MTSNIERDLAPLGSAPTEVPSHGRATARDPETLDPGNPTHVDASPSPRTVVLVLALMTALVGIDVVTDVRQGTALAHVTLEVLVVAIGFVAAGAITLRLRRSAHDAQALRERTAQLAENLRATEQEAVRWRASAADLIAGLSAAIDDQLARWELSPAEREIARLLLKGLSHKEIATIRSVSETTVRQQARSLYRKAGLSGRNDLAAFFLEDLLEPRAV